MEKKHDVPNHQPDRKCIICLIFLSIIFNQFYKKNISVKSRSASWPFRSSIKWKELLSRFQLLEILETSDR